MRRPPRIGRGLIRFWERLATGVVAAGRAEFAAAVGLLSVVVLGVPGKD